jgi:hypothetical protein
MPFSWFGYGSMACVLFVLFLVSLGCVEAGGLSVTVVMREQISSREQYIIEYVGFIYYCDLENCSENNVTVSAVAPCLNLSKPW